MAADAQERGGRSWVSPAANLKMEGAKMTGLQEKQMAWLDRQEHYEVLREMRGGGWTSLANYVVKCNTCKDEIVCHTADTAKWFIYEHLGHYTWITNMGRTKL